MIIMSLCKQTIALTVSTLFYIAHQEKIWRGSGINTTYYSNLDVPVPGIHESLSIKYLETCVVQLERPLMVDVAHIPEVNCPLDSLLPPNFEVLKMAPSAYELPVLWRIASAKATDTSYLPSLRKTILETNFQ